MDFPQGWRNLLQQGAFGRIAVRSAVGKAQALPKEFSPLIASVTLHFWAASAAIFLAGYGAISALLFSAVQPLICPLHYLL